MPNANVQEFDSFAESYSKVIPQILETTPISTRIASSSYLVVDRQSGTWHIPTIKNLSGLAPYDPLTGTKAGEVKIIRTPYNLEARRGIAIAIDRLSVQQQGGADIKSAITAMLTQNYTISELDAFRFSRWGENAKARGQYQEEILDEENIIDAIMHALQKIDASRMKGRRTIFINANLQWTLMKSKYFIKNMSYNPTVPVNADLTVGFLRGYPVVPVFSSEFKTAVDIDNPNFGVHYFDHSQEMNFLIAVEESVWYGVGSSMVGPSNVQENFKNHGLEAERLVFTIHHGAGVIEGLHMGVYVSLMPSVQTIQAHAEEVKNPKANKANKAKVNQEEPKEEGATEVVEE